MLVIGYEQVSLSPVNTVEFIAENSTVLTGNSETCLTIILSYAGVDVSDTATFKRRLDSITSLRGFRCIEGFS